MGEEIERKFGALAQKALSGNAESFLKLVSERFEKHKAAAEADLGERQKAIEGMMKPIAENLSKFEAQVGEIEKAREGAYGAIQAQIRTLADGQMALRGETARLVQALRQPKTRGSWGEFQLRQVFEMAGMVEHVDFLTEHIARPRRRAAAPGRRSSGCRAASRSSSMPRRRSTAILALIEAEDEQARGDALKTHVRHVRQHIANLSRKEYWSALDVTPDFVVMFMPNEAMYSCAIDAEPGIFEEAMRNRVLISTPTNFIALIKAIAYGWQEEKLARNAQRGGDAGARSLRAHRQVRRAPRRPRQGAAPARSSKYNDSVGSLEGRVLPQARKFERLGVVGAGAELPEPGQVEIEPRVLAAAEFAAERAA